ncbi:MAG TPA: formate dehydrogenase accessory sulfurtransferase FdhD [Actinomycetota bacterium]
MTDRPGPTVRVTARAVRDGGSSTRSDQVAAEEPMEIRVTLPGAAEQSLAITMRTPGNDFELAVGFLATEGVVRTAEDLDAVRYCIGTPVEQQFNIVTVALRGSARFDPTRLARNFYTTSSCGVCGKTSLEALALLDPPPIPEGPVVDPAVVTSLPEALRARQRLFERTGGLHAAGLFDARGDLILVREDVGRHNAVDKLVGALVLERRYPAGETILAVSGRASFEIMQKALAAGIPFVAAVGAPSSLAVQTAETFGMSLAGFVRDGSFNLYAGAGRVHLS